MYFLHFQVYRMDSTVNAVCWFLFVCAYPVLNLPNSNFGCSLRSLWLKPDDFAHVLVQLAMAKDPEAAFFKRLEGLQPCEVLELKAGTHIFAVYGLLFGCFIFLHNCAVNGTCW